MGIVVGQKLARDAVAWKFRILGREVVTSAITGYWEARAVIIASC